MCYYKKIILIFSIAYHPYVGGAEIAWKEITDRIIDYDFHMLTPRYDKKLSKTEKIGNVVIYRIGFGMKIDKFLLPIFGPIKAFFLNKKYSYRCSIGIMYNHAGLAASLFKILRPKIKFILNLQDGDTDEVINKKTRGIRFLTDIIYSKPDIIIAIANFLSQRAKIKGFNDNPILIPNGVDIGKFSQIIDSKTKSQIRDELGFNSDDKIIVTTSRLNYKNAINDIINSLTYLPKNFKLLIIGSGEEENNLKNLTQRLNLSDRIVFGGFISHDKIVPFLKSSNFFCRPSLQEGLGNSFLEAMMAGIPVIATRVGGIPDFLKNNETGVFCEVRNPKSIADAILKINSDEILRSRIIKNAKITIGENYNWDLIAKRYENLFRNLMR